MTFNHWKIYEPIHGVTTFDRDNAGPTITDLEVIANTHASDTYPDARIAIVIGGLGSVGLTAKQSAALRTQLERAERDARAEAQRPVTAAGNEGRCEACSRQVRASELVHVIHDGAGEFVVVHAGPCPSEERRHG